MSAPTQAGNLLPRRGLRHSQVAVAAVTTVYVALLGTAAGLIWAALAPKVSIPAIAAGASAAFHAQVGADVWFLVVGAIAGVLCAVAAIALLREEGPGLAFGLAFGGSLAAVIADRVGYLSEQHATTAALRALGATPSGSTISEIDFRVRALGVLTAWPLASLIVLGIVIAIGAARR
jgi:hypothetical protein